jgi:DUF1009 family protein
MSAISVKTIGIICGGTDLAEVTIRSTLAKGKKPVIIAIENEADEQLGTLFENVHWLQVGNIARAIEIFKREDVNECLMVGRVDHRRIFESINFDRELYKVYTALKDHKANSLLEAFIKVFEENGLKFIDTTEYLKEYLAPKGIIGKVQPDEKISADIRFGWELAKKIGELDIGQAVLVKDRAVVAVEAIEGTDELIKRSKTLCPSGAVLVKAAKPKQDSRFDMPVVGPQTIKNLVEIKAAALAIEAGATIIINLQEMTRIADENGIVFWGVSGEV